MGRRDLQSLSPCLRGTKRTLNMYIWRDNSVRSHGSREAGGESQALRGIIQFPRIFQFRVRRKICFSRVRGFILWLYMSSQHKFITCFHLSFLLGFSFFLPFFLVLFVFYSFVAECVKKKHVSKESQPRLSLFRHTFFVYYT